MTQSITSLTFPIVCPNCGEKSGFPVETSDQTQVVVTVVISCSSCFRRWTEQAAQPPILLPKPDRRQK